MQEERKLKLRDRSTLTFAEYIVDHIIFGVILGYDLSIILPKIVPYMYFAQNILIIAVCLIATSIFGIAVSWKNNRTGKGVIIDIISGYGLYIGLILGKYVPDFMKTVLYITIAMTIIGLMLISLRKIKKKQIKKQIIFGRLLKSTQLVRRNVGVACACVLIFVPFSLHFNENAQLTSDYKKIRADVLNPGHDLGISESANLVVDKVYDEKYNLENNIDTIKYIRNDEEFSKLSYEEKCNLVETIARCEACYLGLEEFYVSIEELEDYEYGYFNQRTKTLMINSNLLKDSEKGKASARMVLDTVLHECRHYYQELMIKLYEGATERQRNLYVFTHEGVAEWNDNYHDYHSEIDYYEAYRDQVIEVDSRNYSDKMIKWYYEEIDKYLDKNIKTQKN